VFKVSKKVNDVIYLWTEVVSNKLYLGPIWILSFKLWPLNFRDEISKQLNFSPPHVIRALDSKTELKRAYLDPIVETLDI
jgi:hypothetical protein